jgi:replicative DNA helicase
MSVYAGFFYLSSLDSKDISSEVSLLKNKLAYIPDSFKEFYKQYLDYYSMYSKFPDQFECQKILSVDEIPSGDLKSLYRQQLIFWESSHLLQVMEQAPLMERRAKLSKLVELLDSTQVNDVQVDNVSEIDFKDLFVKKEGEVSRIIFPLKDLNKRTVVKNGDLVTIMAPPASCKTTFALNIVYHNSFLEPKNSLYIYLEDQKESYIGGLLSRFSCSHSIKVERSSLKVGIPNIPSNKEAVEKLKKLNADFKAAQKGKIYFSSFGEFSKDADIFIAQVAKLVDKLQLDLIFLDHLQALRIFAPPQSVRREYISDIVSGFRSIALATAGNKKQCTAFILTQLNREAEKRAASTEGKNGSKGFLNFTAYSASDVASIETDSFLIIGLYASSSMNESNELQWKILKNRNLAPDTASQTTLTDLSHCYIGDFDSVDSSEMYSSGFLSELIDDKPVNKSVNQSIGIETSDSLY